MKIRVYPRFDIAVWAVGIELDFYWKFLKAAIGPFYITLCW